MGFLPIRQNRIQAELRPMYSLSTTLFFFFCFSWHSTIAAAALVAREEERVVNPSSDSADAPAAVAAAAKARLFDPTQPPRVDAELGLVTRGVSFPPRPSSGGSGVGSGVGPGEKGQRHRIIGFDFVPMLPPYDDSVLDDLLLLRGTAAAGDGAAAAAEREQVPPKALEKDDARPDDPRAVLDREEGSLLDDSSSDAAAGRGTNSGEDADTVVVSPGTEDDATMRARSNATAAAGQLDGGDDILVNEVMVDSDDQHHTTDDGTKGVDLNLNVPVEGPSERDDKGPGVDDDDEEVASHLEEGGPEIASSDETTSREGDARIRDEEGDGEGGDVQEDRGSVDEEESEDLTSLSEEASLASEAPDTTTSATEEPDASQGDAKDGERVRVPVEDEKDVSMDDQETVARDAAQLGNLDDDEGDSGIEDADDVATSSDGEAPEEGTDSVAGLASEDAVESEEEAASPGVKATANENEDDGSTLDIAPTPAESDTNESDLITEEAVPLEVEDGAIDLNHVPDSTSESDVAQAGNDDDDEIIQDSDSEKDEASDAPTQTTNDNLERLDDVKEYTAQRGIADGETGHGSVVLPAGVEEVDGARAGDTEPDVNSSSSSSHVAREAEGETVGLDKTTIDDQTGAVDKQGDVAQPALSSQTENVDEQEETAQSIDATDTEEKENETIDLDQAANVDEQESAEPSIDTKDTVPDTSWSPSRRAEGEEKEDEIIDLDQIADGSEHEGISQPEEAPHSSEFAASEINAGDTNEVETEQSQEAESPQIPFDSSDFETPTEESANASRLQEPSVIEPDIDVGDELPADTNEPEMPPEVDSGEEQTTKEDGETLSADSAQTQQQAPPVGLAPSSSRVNAEFIDGIDDLHKFIEEVDPPDELDIGAMGTSMQEVLMGKSIQILNKRISRGVGYVRKASAKLGGRLKERAGNLRKKAGNSVLARKLKEGMESSGLHGFGDRFKGRLEKSGEGKGLIVKQQERLASFGKRGKMFIDHKVEQCRDFLGHDAIDSMVGKCRGLMRHVTEFLGMDDEDEDMEEYMKFDALKGRMENRGSYSSEQIVGTDDDDGMDGETSLKDRLAAVREQGKKNAESVMKTSSGGEDGVSGSGTESSEERNM